MVYRWERTTYLADLDGFGGYFMLGETVHNLFSSGEFLQWIQREKS